MASTISTDRFAPARLRHRCHSSLNETVAYGAHVTDLVAHLGALSNGVHGFIYFAETAEAEYGSLGLAGSQQYFASRSAAFGAVGPAIVTATFFNFNPDRVHDAVPSCWEAATPTDIQAARMRAAGAVLQSACPGIDGQTIAEATELAAAMVDGLGDEGRALAAANRAVPLPDDPWAALWQLVTIIREWRGDAHVAALTAAPVTAVEALVLHAATGQVPRAVLQMTRGWSDEAWSTAVDALASRGLVAASGEFTDAGRDFRQAIEDQTNRAAQPLVDALGVERTERLCELLRPMRKGLVEAGAFARLLGT